MNENNLFSTILKNHSKIDQRRKASNDRLSQVREKFTQNKYISNQKDITIFCAGSLARLEIGTESDLDLFIIHTSEQESVSKLTEYTLFSNLIQLNEQLEFPTFSNDGEFLQINRLDKLIQSAGSKQDDNENLFTTRMLLLLESKHITNDSNHQKHLEEVIKHYHKDDKDGRDFRPIFLINDLLRYWRTLHLNYENKRNDDSKPWRKKNINLKFSRMLTVFATILPLVSEEKITTDRLFHYCELTPLQRFAEAFDQLNNVQLEHGWSNFLDIYEDFLSWKENPDIEKELNNEEFKKKVNDNAKEFKDFIYKALMDKKNSKMKQYLVI